MSSDQENSKIMNVRVDKLDFEAIRQLDLYDRIKAKNDYAKWREDQRNKDIEELGPPKRYYNKGYYQKNKEKWEKYKQNRKAKE